MNQLSNPTLIPNLTMGSFSKLIKINRKIEKNEFIIFIKKPNSICINLNFRLDK